MNFTEIRKSLDVSQPEMAILLGVSTGSIRNWEQGRRGSGGAVHTLYCLVKEKDQSALSTLMTLACKKKYCNLNDALIAMRILPKLVQSKLLRSILEVSLIASNPQWKPEQLGFRVTTINR